MHGDDRDEPRVVKTGEPLWNMFMQPKVMTRQAHRLGRWIDKPGRS